MKSFWRWLMFLGIVLAVIAVVGVYAWGRTNESSPQIQTVSYSEFRVQDNLAKVVIFSDSIKGLFPNGDAVIAYVPDDINRAEIARLFTEQRIPVWYNEISQGFDVPWFPIVFLGAVLFFVFFIYPKVIKPTLQKQSELVEVQSELLKQQQVIGQSKVREFIEERPKTKFFDVAGLDTAKEQLKQIVNFLKDPSPFFQIGAQIPRGILLKGPPGSGKTLLARAVAGESEVPFFSISASEFVEMFVGRGAARVRDLFKKAREKAPCIIFIDEIDAVGRRRGSGYGMGHDEREQTLNQILIELDGFEPTSNIVVLAATNRPDILDPALTREGRFDKHIELPLPDKKTRKEIFEIHLQSRKHCLTQEVLENFAGLSGGRSGADIAAIVNEAALEAVMQNHQVVEESDLSNGFDNIVLGYPIITVMSDQEAARISIHEAGHAIVIHKLEILRPILRLYKISIIRRGKAGGHNAFIHEDRLYHTKEEFWAMITGALAGRAAEEIIYKNQSTMAAADIELASTWVEHMFQEFGFGENLPPLVYQKEGVEGKVRDYSEETAKALDQEKQRLIKNCLAMAYEILENARPELKLLAQTLAQRKEMRREELEIKTA